MTFLLAAGAEHPHSSVFDSVAVEVLAYALGAVIVAVVLWLAHHGVKALRGLLMMAEDWRGIPDRPGVPGRQGVMERLAAGDTRFKQIDERLNQQDEALKELRPNGGGSAFDMVREIYKTTTGKEPPRSR